MGEHIQKRTLIFHQSCSELKQDVADMTADGGLICFMFCFFSSLGFSQQNKLQRFDCDVEGWSFVGGDLDNLRPDSKLSPPTHLADSPACTRLPENLLQFIWKLKVSLFAQKSDCRPRTFHCCRGNKPSFLSHMKCKVEILLQIVCFPLKTFCFFKTSHHQDKSSCSVTLNKIFSKGFYILINLMFKLLCQHTHIFSFCLGQGSSQTNKTSKEKQSRRSISQMEKCSNCWWKKHVELELCNN